MTQDVHQPFLDAIIAAIHDDSPRLQYADWLEEQGNEARAEFIRVQCELARTPEPAAKTITPLVPTKAYHEREGICVRCTDDAECRYHVLTRREKELMLAQPFFVGACGGVVYGMRNEPTTEMACAAPGGKSKINGIFRRGLVAEITLACADWLACREVLLRKVPLEKVTLTRYFVLTGTAEQITICPSEHDRNPYRPVSFEVRRDGLHTIDGPLRGIKVVVKDYDSALSFVVEQFGIPEEVFRGNPSAPLPQGIINYPTRRRRR